MLRLLLAAAILLAPAFAAGAQAADFHEIFESRCAGCHGHAGAFARERLSIEDGAAVGSGGRDLRPFLARHAGGLPPEEIELFLAVFARQIESGGLYQRKCEICHVSAHELARSKLILRDGVLFGRYTDRDIGAFLRGHGRLTPEEAAEMTDALAALLRGAR